jgi:hypothetical protein
MKTEEISEAIERIFKNTERIHDKSDVLDWIKIASIRSAKYLEKQIEQPQPSLQLTDEKMDKQIKKNVAESVNEHGYAETEAVRFYAIGFKQGAKYARDQIKVSLRDELVKFQIWCEDSGQMLPVDLKYCNEVVDNYLTPKNQ